MGANRNRRRRLQALSLDHLAWLSQGEWEKTTLCRCRRGEGVLGGLTRRVVVDCRYWVGQLSRCSVTAPMKDARYTSFRRDGCIRRCYCSDCHWWAVGKRRYVVRRFSRSPLSRFTRLSPQPSVPFFSQFLLSRRKVCNRQEAEIFR